MDYEKAYKEVLAWMRELYPGLHGATKEDAEHYFPELRESEDERIRKEINTLYSEIDTCISELLEARTDKDSEAEGKALFKMEGLMVATLQDLSCIEDYLEKQKEQILKDAVEGTVTCHNLNRYILVSGLDESLTYGDKVRIIIVKEVEQ